MRPSLLVFLFSCMIATLSIASTRSDTMPPGRYEAKVQGDDDIYSFEWVIKKDGTYNLKMAGSEPEGKKSRMRGRYEAAGDSIYLKGNSLKDGEGWKPYPDDAYAVTRVNDSTYHVVIMKENEADFVLRSKD